MALLRVLRALSRMCWALSRKHRTLLRRYTACWHLWLWGQRETGMTATGRIDMCLSSSCVMQTVAACCSVLQRVAMC